MLVLFQTISSFLSPSPSPFTSPPPSSPFLDVFLSTFFLAPCLCPNNTISPTPPQKRTLQCHPLLPHPRRRRSSLLDKWIKDQQTAPSTLPILRASSSPPNPYLAYPDLPFHALSIEDDTATVDSYDLVDDQDIQKKKKKKRSRHNRHSLPILPALVPMQDTVSRPDSLSASNFPRFYIYPFPASQHKHLCFHFFFSFSYPAHASQHTRSASLSATDIGQLQSSRSKSYLARAGSPSKWRPTVLGHFSQVPSSPSGAHSTSTFFTPSRPSISSADTSNTHQSSAPTASSTPESQPPATPTKSSFIDSIRFKSRSRSTMFKSQPTTGSSSSLYSQPNIPERSSTSNTSCSSLSHLPDEEDDVDTYDLPNNTRNDSTIKSTRPSAFSASATLSRAAFSSLSVRRQKKKRKLVVSGVGVREIRKLDGVKCWCESFGEVKQITRMPNGDLHVDFRSADVATLSVD
ncbi:hypothetical protein BDQ17DRAFT_1418649 [Cyathus striatus]|nr:hypothetical protein BDQ17DRAFT_1418649 [Cyathus striatus]